MKRVFIIHRWGATPKSDWYPWLKEQLEKDGYEVHVPAMPDTEIPVIEKWIGCLSDAVGTPDNETYFVGHSIGCQTILRYLDSHMFEPLETVGGAVFVAGWFNLENLESDEEKNIAAPWIERPVNPEKIKTILPRSTLIISDDDPYGAFEENKTAFAALMSKEILVPHAGHFTEEDHCTTLPIVVEEMERFE